MTQTKEQFARDIEEKYLVALRLIENISLLIEPTPENQPIIKLINKWAKE